MENFDRFIHVNRLRRRGVEFNAAPNTI